MARLRSLSLLLCLCLGACRDPAPICSRLCVAPHLGTLDLVAGQPGGPGAVDGTGAAAHFSDPWTFAGDPAGPLYLVDGSTLRAIDRQSGAVTTLAGVFGTIGGSDGVGAQASFNQPNGLALDGGTLYVADTENHTVRAVDLATATVTTFAGGFESPGSDDGPASTARFREPEGLAADANHNLWLADTDNNTIRRIALDSGTVTTIAGTAGAPGSDDGSGAAARFNKPRALALDGSGHLFVLDSLNGSIRKLTLAATPVTVTTLATFSAAPTGLVADGADVLATLADHRLVHIDGATGAVTTLAGAANEVGFVDGPGAGARLFRPAGLWNDGAGTIWIADNGNTALRTLTLPGGSVSTVAGANPIGSSDGVGAQARFFLPQSIVVDASGTVFVADTNNHTVRKVLLASGEVSTVAGAAGQAAYADGSASDARFNQPTSLALDETARLLYVADAGNHSIRSIDLDSGEVATLEANGAPGSMFARFGAPAGLALDGGRLFVSDSTDHVVLALDLATHLVTNLAGLARTAGASNGVGAKARFNSPAGLASDGRGNLYVADVLNDAVRRIVLGSGEVSTIAGVLTVQGSDDGDAASAHFAYPSQLAVDGLGDLYVADALNNTVRHVDLSRGVVTTAIGATRLAGVRLGALPAQLGMPTALALTGDGSLALFSESALLLAH